MPTVVENTVPAFAHCQDGKCIGNKQQPVEGIRTTTSFTYIDMGGDLPGTERSTEMVRFADEVDAVCPHCDGPRIVTEQPRPQYANVSGQPQDALLHLGETQARVREVEHARELDLVKRESEMKDLKHALEMQAAQIAQLTAALAEKANKPGPKPRTDG